MISATPPKSTVVVCTSDGTVDRVISGCPLLLPKLVPGTKVGDVLHSLDPVELEAAFQSVLHSDHTIELHCRLASADEVNTELTWRVVLSSLQPDVNAPRVIVVCCRAESSRDEVATFRAVLHT
ncbi:MAG: hypothetical protein KDA96_12620, partial [Planctomycetaceae bacterium]|nr:hypothetical protein [Planctomycetaceae bacterium]